MRPTSTSRDVRAACKRCGQKWTGKNAQAVAARHYDATGHETYVDVVMTIRYGGSQEPDLRLL